MNINKYLLQYSINSLVRQKSKNIFIFIIFTLLIFLITSVFFIANSIKYELNLTVDKLPSITIQKLRAGKVVDIETSRIDDIIDIVGIEDVIPRVWGYYYFENANVNFSIVGLDNYESKYTKSLDKVTDDINLANNLEDGYMLVGSGVKKILNENYYKEYFNFIISDGTLKKVKIDGVFKSEIELQSNDMMIVSKELAYDILGLHSDMSTDIVVKVSNPEELPTIVEKIQLLYPDTKVITNEDFKISYQNIFDYKSGVFLALFIISLFTFFIIIYDKTSGLTSSEKTEIGILKAVGWRVDDILKEKFYESFILSFFSYTTGVMISFGFVYFLDAPLLRNIFEGYSQLKTTFNLPFVVDFQILTLVFFITVPIYIAATIIPSWRTATLDADEVIR